LSELIEWRSNSEKKKRVFEKERGGNRGNKPGPQVPELVRKEKLGKKKKTRERKGDQHGRSGKRGSGPKKLQGRERIKTGERVRFDVVLEKTRVSGGRKEGTVKS